MRAIDKVRKPQAQSVKKQEKAGGAAEEQQQAPQQPVDEYNANRTGAVAAVAGISQFAALSQNGAVRTGAAALGALITVNGVMTTAKAKTTRGKITGAVQTAVGLMTTVAAMAPGAWGQGFMMASGVALGVNHVANRPTETITNTAKEIGAMAGEVGKGAWDATAGKLFKGGDDAAKA